MTLGSRSSTMWAVSRPWRMTVRRRWLSTWRLVDHGLAELNQSPDLVIAQLPEVEVARHDRLNGVRITRLLRHALDAIALAFEGLDAGQSIAQDAQGSRQRVLVRWKQQLGCECPLLIVAIEIVVQAVGVLLDDLTIATNVVPV